MVIGVIGASIAGLTAANKLARKGHEVMVFEKEDRFAGRLKTTKVCKNKVTVDIDSSYVEAESETFEAFCEELSGKGILSKYEGDLHGYGGHTLSVRSTLKRKKSLYYAPKGVDQIGNYLSRWADVHFNNTVVGVTYIGNKPHVKKKWMINLSNFNVFEVDAIIVALPAIQAYGILDTCQDETPIRKLISHIDEIAYEPCITMVANYGHRPIPEWFGIEMGQEFDLQWIGNESMKRGISDELVVVSRASGDFYRSHKHLSDSEIADKMLSLNKTVVGKWGDDTLETAIFKFKYHSVINPISEPFYIAQGLDSFALVGDYFDGNSLEAGFVSGKKLADTWLS